VEMDLDDRENRHKDRIRIDNFLSGITEEKFVEQMFNRLLVEAVYEYADGPILHKQIAEIIKDNKQLAAEEVTEAEFDE
jgi:hypothetical protein